MRDLKNELKNKKIINKNVKWQNERVWKIKKSIYFFWILIYNETKLKSKGMMLWKKQRYIFAKK